MIEEHDIKNSITIIMLCEHLRDELINEDIQAMPFDINFITIPNMEFSTLTSKTNPHETFLKLTNFACHLYNHGP